MRARGSAGSGQNCRVPDDGVPDGDVPDEIVPDDKDWTWVLERPCPECGFDARSVELGEVGELIRANAGSWVTVFGGDGASVRSRPVPDRWSTLEYGAHVRDVYVLFARRLAMMLDTDDPLLPNWDQDETAAASRYDLQDPATVAVELRAAADALADAFDAVEHEQWARPGRRSDGASFTVASFARYLIHDPVHHLWDCGIAAPGRA
jgi:hypothetical protein